MFEMLALNTFFDTSTVALFCFGFFFLSIIWNSGNQKHHITETSWSLFLPGVLGSRGRTANSQYANKKHKASSFTYRHKNHRKVNIGFKSFALLSSTHSFIPLIVHLVFICPWHVQDMDQRSKITTAVFLCTSWLSTAWLIWYFPSN